MFGQKSSGDYINIRRLAFFARATGREEYQDEPHIIIRYGENKVAPVNNVTRYLDSRKIEYAIYELPKTKLGALETARLLKVDPAIVFKTIVILQDKPKKPVLALVPGTRAVDLKLLASFLGEKKVYLPTERATEELTGLQAGGISPLALLHKGFQVVIDSSAGNSGSIHISAGERGLNIRLAVVDLLALTKAGMANISRDDPSSSI